ncbi:hypothetical protein KGB42_gp09 [Salmonella phage Seszw_1]|uniref:Uncharacterized protein n=1 Tax=Salmonella phage Seszw_1 TaxID=2479482 RepID=A0A411BF19_9CAUD|nr:hypothetical protein KGB42_gp09 [Salmonella phage Seszw_1]QZB85723.1 hypothetical protein seszw10L_9 [Salmonella phage seszw]QAY00220.1 hypothetical protein Seszw_9 [Salmonella phage Seszw_1]QZB85804.1 hypothetical protein seszw10S_9 [Salmonella phage seszw]QZB85884.1 hypothetical protein seszw20L_9 [Salmonella phage seszw]QZB85963.1 hypothetical protein seszw20S_9 [Salmonella phage seszw]
MRWAIKHKTGRTLFVTSDEFIANNRSKMGWIVEGVKMTSREQFSREQFEEWVKKETGFDLCRTNYPMTEWADQKYESYQTHLAWMAWQASRSAIEIELPTTIEVHPFGPSAAKMFCELHKNTVAECAKSILAAGLKVKS